MDMYQHEYLPCTMLNAIGNPHYSTGWMESAIYTKLNYSALILKA